MKSPLDHRKHALLIVGALACLLTVSALLGGCNRSEKKVLRIWETENDPAAAKIVDRIARELEATHPGLKIEHEAIPWNDLSNKLAAAMAAGDPPDVSHLEPFMVASFQSKGLLAPIDDVIEAIGPNRIYPAVKDLQLFDGHRYGIAYAIGTTFFAYRQDWAKAKGLTIPQTWAEFLRFAKALQEDTNGDGIIDRYGVTLPGGSPFFMDQLTAELVASNGGRLFDEKGTPTFTEQPVIEALEFWRELAKLAPPDWTSEAYTDQFRTFASGKVAIVPVTYARAAKQIEKDAAVGIGNPEHFAVMEQPHGPSGQRGMATIDCEPWTIFAQSKNIALAKEFLLKFYAKENYLEYCRQVPIHLTPILQDLAESKEYREDSFIKRWQPWLQQSLKMLQEKRVNPIFLASQTDRSLPFLMELQGSRILTDMVLAVTQEHKTPQEAAAEAQRKAVNFIAASR